MEPLDHRTSPPVHAVSTGQDGDPDPDLDAEAADADADDATEPHPDAAPAAYHPPA